MPIFGRTANDETIPGIGRLLALTDGFVAIALTLLVLQLQIPAKDCSMATRTLRPPCGMRRKWTARS